MQVNHIAIFVEHRIRLFPTSEQQIWDNQKNSYYWKYLVYEVLFLWSALNNASPADLNCIVSDCCAVVENNMEYAEPMKGLRYLILGGALVCLKNYQEAVNAYR